MLFTSIEFYLFLTTIFIVWAISPSVYRNSVLLMASYAFCCAWKPWFALALFLPTATTWFIAIRMSNQKELKIRKRLLFIVSMINLSPLVFFKYFDFFNNSLSMVLQLGGIINPIPHLNLLLPVGISFFTFQALAYCFDVYSGRILPEKHFKTFALYISFFPKLVSGPIERGEILLPQLHRPTKLQFDIFISGVSLFFWGMFKKVVVADRLSMYVDMVFKHPQDYFGKTAILAAWLFSLQIYCDFSAYTDMARGCGHIFGIELSQNFDFPYFSKSVSEFWRRWHITLTTWFRDYVYIPLGGNKARPAIWAGNIMFVFLLSGLWHGANWTFVFWGGLHGFFYLFGKFTSKIRRTVKQFFWIRGWVDELLRIFITFNLIALSWVFFRADSIQNAFTLIKHMGMHLSAPVRMMSSQFSTALAFSFALIYIGLEIVAYSLKRIDNQILNSIPKLFIYPIYACGLVIIALLGVSSHEFIYFHF